MTDPTKPQLDRRDIERLDPEAIVDAHAAGRLDRLLGVPEPVVEAKQRAKSESALLTLRDVALLAEHGEHELIDQAQRADRIDLNTEAIEGYTHNDTETHE